MNLMIVESPSKAKTIEKYLGSGWNVIASVGHVRDLVPENGSVDTEHNFKMRWQIMPGKEKQLKLITDALKKELAGQKDLKFSKAIECEVKGKGLMKTFDVL